MSTSTLYDRDFYAWANEQAGLLREGKLTQADIEHIAEEIESMGKSEKRELVSRLTILLLHLIKWQFQAPKRSKSWQNSVEVQRISLDSHLRDNPSLKSVLDSSISEAYRVARLEAENETGIDKNTFPVTCPWSFDQMIAEDFWPEA
ncbi:DUF29 domain-containing protein [Acidiphilium acidophilum]|uniref:DUF29 domain-containing protein n=1 Tax=Acidiphilium acidophilum TaxID=76588 RepID=A0AAW9DKN5_ACIAO|nr:DUF29 domain-containing protein [Acidiphilium acidophilum]MDX5929660.1 DUF29 domain-containing protein [Acidiphilium acidophilum]MDX5929669.1 DUF29 domain-containing protein [Acidiphilium acidophilum]